MSREEIDAEILRAINALEDAREWLREGNYEQASAAASEARGIVYTVNDELVWLE